MNGRDLHRGTVGEVVVESATWRSATSTIRTRRLRSSPHWAMVGGRTGDRPLLTTTAVSAQPPRRRDQVRGYLVEPAEVEAAIRALPWATDVVVTAVVRGGRPPPTSPSIRPRRSPSPSEIRQALSRIVGAVDDSRDVVVLAELPRNEAGQGRQERFRDRLRGSSNRCADLTEANPVARRTLRSTRSAAQDFISLGGDPLLPPRSNR